MGIEVAEVYGSINIKGNFRVTNKEELDQLKEVMGVHDYNSGNTCAIAEYMDYTFDIDGPGEFNLCYMKSWDRAGDSEVFFFHKFNNKVLSTSDFIEGLAEIRKIISRYAEPFAFMQKCRDEKVDFSSLSEDERALLDRMDSDSVSDAYSLYSHFASSSLHELDTRHFNEELTTFYNKWVNYASGNQ